jgi:tetratricopeptide (TPR) repeat protein
MAMSLVRYCSHNLASLSGIKAATNPIAAASATNASGFLLVSLTKMPRLAIHVFALISPPSHFRSRLATIRPKLAVLRVELVRQYAGRRLQRLGRLTEAAGFFRQALAELEVMRSAKPGQPRGTAVTLGNEEGLAEIYAEQGDRDAALTYARKALDRAQKYDALTPGRAVSIGFLGEAYFELAWVECTLGAWAQAGADAERAICSGVRSTKTTALFRSTERRVNERRLWSTR